MKNEALFLFYVQCATDVLTLGAKAITNRTDDGSALSIAKFAITNDI